MSEPLWILFLVGGPAFWVLLLCASGVMAAIVDDHPGWGLAFFIATLLVFGEFSDAGLGWIVRRPDWLFIGGIAYFGIGVLWSFGKWLLLNVDRRAEYLAAAAVWRAEKTTGYSRPGGPPKLANYKPQAAAYSDRLIGWIAWWPFSAARFLLGDFVTRVARRLYQLMATRYAAVSNYVFADVADAPPE